MHAWKPKQLESGEVEKLAREKGALVSDNFAGMVEELFKVNNPSSQIQDNGSTFLGSTLSSMS
jgi:hypothetical protein